MATYLADDALRLPAASLLANSGLCVNIEIKIWLLLGVNVDTAYFKHVLSASAVAKWLASWAAGCTIPGALVEKFTTRRFYAESFTLNQSQ